MCTNKQLFLKPNLKKNTGQVNQQASVDRPVSSLLGLYSLLLTPAEKVENLNSWHNFLFVVFTPQTSSCGPERWVGSTKKTMFAKDTSRKGILAAVPIC